MKAKTAIRLCELAARARQPPPPNPPDVARGREGSLLNRILRSTVVVEESKSQVEGGGVLGGEPVR